jgi:NADH-quinone oxidoreductase subunit C
MTTVELADHLKAKYPDKVSDLSTTKVDPFVVVKAESLVDLCRYLKTTPALSFDYLQDLTAVDWQAKNVIEVVYHLFSMTHRHQLILKVELDRAAPSIPTVESVWRAATWLEREVYDLFGVTFVGLSDPRRILMPDDWVGHPLRKDYQEAGGYHGIDNVRPDPLVQLTQKTDEVRKAIAAAAPAPVAAPAPAPASVTAPPPASPPRGEAAAPAAGEGTAKPAPAAGEGAPVVEKKE